jgi:hypothetical protein
VVKGQRRVAAGVINNTKLSFEYPNQKLIEHSKKSILILFLVEEGDLKDLLIETFGAAYFPTKKFNSDFKNVDFIRLRGLIAGIASSIETAIDSDAYKVKANFGIGKIATCPWIGIHSRNKGFNSEPQSGIYACVIWNSDGSGVCLTLQQGTDKLSTNEIGMKVENARKNYGVNVFNSSINLKYKRPSSRPVKYQNANICGKDYDRETVVDLVNDIPIILGHYNDIVNKRMLQDWIVEDEIGDEFSYQNNIPRKTDKTVNSSWVRNREERKKAIERAEYCCEFNSEHQTFDKGEGQYMEGHHIIPMKYQSLFGFSIDAVENIVSLCPNCHAKIHLDTQKNRSMMIEEIFLNRLKNENGRYPFGLSLAEVLDYQF